MKVRQIGMLVAVLILVALVIVAKAGKSTKPAGSDAVAPAVASTPATSVSAAADPKPGDVCPTVDSGKPAVAQKPKSAGVAKPATGGKQLPKVLDLGSTGCIPCEKMKPVLAELKTELKGKVDVEFTDIAVDAAAADKYGIRTIPTQIFFDAGGKEVTRHIGFIPKADILAQLKQMGVKGLQ